MRILVAALLLALCALSAQAGSRELVAAIGTGDLSALRNELDAGTDPNGEWLQAPPMATWLPVYLAAEAGRADMLAALVAEGAEIDRRDRNGDRPLDWAARYGETDIVRLLLDAGADVNAVDAERGNVALVNALSGGHIDTARLLLARGASPAVASPNRGSALYWAVSSGDMALVERLIAGGADVNARQPMSRETALHMAALHATPEMIRLLVRMGAAIDARDWDGETPLFLAARVGLAANVMALAEQGAAIDLPDENGRTPLVAALAWRPKPAHEEGLDDPFLSNRALIAQSDLRRGADFDATATFLAGRTADLDRALAEAVWAGYGEVARRLVERGALGQARTLDGRAALAGSFHHPGLSMFDMLAAATTDPGIDGDETIIAAAAAGRFDIIEALLARRYPVDTRDPQGQTALLAAATEGRVALVERLAALGADPAARDRAGNGIAELMKARRGGLICLAVQREGARAYLPTGFIRDKAAQLEAAYAAILAHLGLPPLEWPPDPDHCGI